MKKKKINKSRRKNLIMGGLFLFLIGMMVFYIWIFNYTNSIYSEINTLKREEANLVTQNRLTSVEIDRLARADRIKQIAMRDLNMWTPPPETLTVVIASTEIE